jgi:hypothetical protein
VSAAQPDNGAGAGYQASTQLHPVVIEARSAEENHGAKPRPLIKSCSEAERLDQPLIIGQIRPDILILAHFSGYLTSAPQFTLRRHYIVCAARFSRL